MLCATLFLAASLASDLGDAPVPVSIVNARGQWVLSRGGKPYFVKGAAGNSSLAALKEAGGNSTRTWGAEEIAGKLADAQELGLTVVGGVWLGHKAHGFDYADETQVAKQYDEVKASIEKFKNHSSLLMWALGNEMEMNNDTPEVWKAVGALAKLAKKLDKNHPVMTVVADITEQKIKHIQQFAPDIDVLGVNCYGPLPTLPKRLKKAGWTKPYIITEFGPIGWWESPKTVWGAPLEATSAEKAKLYLSNYERVVSGHPGWCLGSYAFLWGDKQETTPTWFSMFLPSGEATNMVDAMTKAWTGKWPKNRAPEIIGMKFDAARKKVAGGTSVHVTAQVDDPDGDPLIYKWEIRREIEKSNSMGEGESRPEVVWSGSGKSVSIPLPTTPGPYRLYLYVLDGKGKSATSNEPFFILQ